MQPTINKHVFYIEITETLSRTVAIHALTMQDALLIANAQYNEENIVLDAADWIETTFKAIDSPM